MDRLDKMQGCPCFMPEAVNLWAEDIIVSTEIDCRRIKTCRNLALRFFDKPVEFCQWPSAQKNPPADNADKGTG